MVRRAVPARVVAGGTNIRATLAIEGVAPLHAARTSQRDVSTTLTDSKLPMSSWITADRGASKSPTVRLHFPVSPRPVAHPNPPRLSSPRPWLGTFGPE